jgi:hypothetical protein
MAPVAGLRKGRGPEPRTTPARLVYLRQNFGEPLRPKFAERPFHELG